MIHATADVSPEAAIGAGTFIWHYAHVRERARIGCNCIVGRGVYVDFGVRIGDSCKIQNNAQIYHPAVLEDGVFIGPAVLVLNDKVPRAVNPDGTPKGGADWTPAPVVIREGAAIGAGSTLLPGVEVGRWAMVGAGATVVHDVPDHGLVVGNPARLVGYVCRCGRRAADGDGHRRDCDRCRGAASSTAGAR